jgi:hypothetical protein
MNAKSLVISSLVGFVFNFLLGWALWGILFKDFFPMPEGASENLLMIALGCLFSCVLLAYIFLQWANISTATSGIKAGAVIGFFTSLSFNFFMQGMVAMDAINWTTIIMDVVLTVVSTGLTGGVIAFVIGKTK